VNGSLAGTIGEKDGSVDVEEDELHVRVRSRPDMIDSAPTPCQTVGVS
jgi:hypothetical protein